MLVWVLAVFSHWNGWCHQASCLLSNILFYSPFVWSKWEKNSCWSVNAGHVFKGQELGPPGLSRRLLYFKGQTCHLRRTFCQWLVGIRSRFRCDNWWRQRCCKWQNVGLYSSQVLLSATVLNFGEGQRWFSLKFLKYYVHVEPVYFGEFGNIFQEHCISRKN